MMLACLTRMSTVISSRSVFFFTHSILLMTLTAKICCVSFRRHRYTIENAPLMVTHERAHAIVCQSSALYMLT